MNSFVTWIFAGIGVALGAAVPTLFSNVLTWFRRVAASLVQRLQPAERYNDLHIPSWAVEVIGKRENPDDPVVLKVEGSRGSSLVQSIRRTGVVAEPLTREQQQAVFAATRDYGPSGAGWWRRHPPEWTRRELRLARMFALSRGTERCMVFGGDIPGTGFVAVCPRPRWHRGAHHWQRFSIGTLTAEDPGPPD